MLCQHTASARPPTENLEKNVWDRSLEIQIHGHVPAARDTYQNQQNANRLDKDQMLYPGHVLNIREVQHI